MAACPVDPNDPLPLYYQVYTSLLARIRSGEFGAGSPLPAERQLVTEYGVSRITVIKALDELEREHRVSRQRGRGTFVIAPEMPPVHSVQERLIAFAAYAVDHPYIFSILSGIARVAAREHYHLLIISLYEDSDDERIYVAEAIGRGMAGLIVYPQMGYQNLSLYRQLQERRFPVVMIDRYYPQVPTDRVVFADEAAGYQLTEWLLQKGHRRIAVIACREVDVSSIRHRLSGYQRALEANGLPCDDDLIWLDLYAGFDPLRSSAADSQAARALLARRLKHHRPTALLAFNWDGADQAGRDLVSIRAERLPMEPAPRVPVGSELNVEIVAVSHTPSVVQLPYVSACAYQSGETLGGEAARLLIGRLRGTAPEEPQFIQTPMQLLTRQENAAPDASGNVGKEAMPDVAHPATD